MSAVVHLDLLDNTVILRLMNANLFLAYEVCGRLLICSFYFHQCYCLVGLFLKLGGKLLFTERHAIKRKLNPFGYFLLVMLLIYH